MLRLGPTKLAKHLGVSRQSIYRAERSGHIQRGIDGKFDPEQVRADWQASTPLAVGSIHTRMQKESSGPENPPQHPVLVFLQQAWALSLRSMALVLRELETFDSQEKHFACLSIMFLAQWEAVAKDLGLPDGHRIAFTGDMADIIQPGPLTNLESWLSKQPRINLRTQ